MSVPEDVDRVLRVVREEEPPDLTYRGEPTENASEGALLVYFADGPREGDISVMPGGCDEWVEPDGTVYR